ncbi:hypothetical protein HDV03_001007 [Kappamyces sp. JEL0829]|nr:hypothetical protein HDV03_001007 [Kappamyces sp. JEL0829]
MALLLQGIINGSTEFTSSKPFNAILGEYVELHGTLQGTEFVYRVEQICHHPPVQGFRVSCDAFTLSTIDGNDSSAGLKMGLNSMEIQADTVIRYESKSGHQLEYQMLGIKIDQLLSSKKNSGLHGTFWVLDKTSGMRLKAKVTKPWKLEGEFIDKDGTVLDSFSGNILSGVHWKSSKELFFKASEQLDFTVTVPENVLQDSMYSRNVWQPVFDEMEKNPPNWLEADKKKARIEEQQRQLAKERTTPYVSRFGFVCKYTSPPVPSSV